MRRGLLYITFFFLNLVFITAQESNTPAFGLEILSHNMLKFNRSNINPAFSFAGQNESSISLYHRKQWTTFDNAPSVYYLGYTGKLGSKSGIGVAAFQQKAGIFSNTGAILNYSYSAQLGDDTYLTFGLNATIYDSGINGADVISLTDPVLENLENSLIAIAQPGINLSIGNFDVGVYAENIFDYNIKTSEELTEFGEKTFSGHVQYGHDLENLSGIFEDARLIGLVRARKLQDETAFGVSALFDAPSIGWFQVGYESVYGASVGVGFNLLKSISLGYVIEKGLGDGLKDFGLTHEFSLAYSFNKQERNNNSQARRPRGRGRRRPITRPTAPVVQTAPTPVVTPPVAVTPPVVDDGQPSAADMLNARETAPVVEETPPVVVEETPPVVVEETPPAVVEETPPVVVEETPPAVVTPSAVITPPVVTPPVVVQVPENPVTEEDSIRVARAQITKQNEEVIKELQTAKDEFVSEEDLNQLALQKAQELYDVKDDGAETLEGVQSGYYIISNTYRTERYTNVSISRLKKEGIDADFFLNPRDSLNYVYLGRYDTMEGVLGYYKNNDEIAFNNRTSVYKVENDNQDDVVKDKENTAEVRQVLEVPGMEKGFYMITNVFAIPENAEYELQKMREQGLNVNTFVNPKNLYIYIYLESHPTFEEAEKAYNSNLNNTYDKKVLIMSVNQ